MTNAFTVVLLSLVVTHIQAVARDNAPRGGPSTYTRPERAVKPDAQATAALLAAQTVAILAIDAAVLEVTSIDPATHSITVVKRGGIRRGVDAEAARKSVEERVRDWGRFRTIASPAEADLVLVIFEDSVAPTRLSKGLGDTKTRLRDTLAVFQGGAPSPTAQPLWADVSIESVLGALSGSSADKVVNKLRRDVEKLSKKKWTR
jgi:hypothetical protein